MAITTHPDARATVTGTFHFRHMGINCTTQLRASCQFSLKQRQHGFLGWWLLDYGEQHNRPSREAHFPLSVKLMACVPGALITPDSNWNSPPRNGWMSYTNNRQNKFKIALQWLFRFQGHLCWLELGVFDLTPEIHKSKYLCLFLHVSLKNKDFWLEDSLNSSWNWNDQPKISAINLTEKLCAIKRHSSLPPNQAGNMIDSVNLHQAMSDILDPLLLCD